MRLWRSIRRCSTSAPRSATRSSGSWPRTRASDDLAVLRAVLNCKIANTNSNCSPTCLPRRSATMTSPLIEPSRSLGPRMAARSRTAGRWPRVNLCPAVQIVDAREIDAAFDRKTHIPPTWDGFHARFPGAVGWMSVSLPRAKKTPPKWRGWNGLPIGDPVDRCQLRTGRGLKRIRELPLVRAGGSRDHEHL